MTFNLASLPDIQYEIRHYKSDMKPPPEIIIMAWALPTTNSNAIIRVKMLQGIDKTVEVGHDQWEDTMKAESAGGGESTKHES